MIMALAHCQYRESFPLLEDLSRRHFQHSRVLTAIGDALVRLGRETDNDPHPLLTILGQENHWCLLDGALRATAMLQLRFDSDTSADILKRVESRRNEALLFWAAAACAGWEGPAVDDSLKHVPPAIVRTYKRRLKLRGSPPIRSGIRFESSVFPVCRRV
jgi:hypothetical protein